MQQKSQNNRTMVLAVVLIALLIVAYKVVFVVPIIEDSESIYDENTAAVARIESVRLEIESINFDTSVFDSSEFRSLQDIDTPLVPLPTGKSNPFAS